MCKSRQSSRFIETWNTARTGAIAVSLSALIVSMPLAWWVITSFKPGAMRYTLLVLLGGVVGMIAVMQRLRLARISRCPGCGGNLISMLMLAKRKGKIINHCPLCGHTM